MWGTDYITILFFLELKSFYDNNQKSEMTARWRNYSGNLQKIFNIIGPTT